MREAIEDLRNRARWYREVPRSRTAVGPDKRDEKAEQADRAADLLEALSNPPETVEELRERIESMDDRWQPEVFDGFDSEDCPDIPGIKVSLDDLTMTIDGLPQWLCVAMAHAAIVAMRERDA